MTGRAAKFRLSPALAAVIAATITGLATILAARQQQASLRGDLHQVTQTLASQNQEVQRLAAAVQQREQRINALEAQIATTSSEPSIASGPAVSVLDATHQEDSVTAEGGFVVSNVSCRRSGDTVTCRFKVADGLAKPSRATLIVGRKAELSSQAFDENGSRHDSVAGSFGGSDLRSEIPDGVPIGGIIVFRHVPRDVYIFNGLRIAFEEFVVEFHRVLIAA